MVPYSPVCKSHLCHRCSCKMPRVFMHCLYSIPEKHVFFYSQKSFTTNPCTTNKMKLTILHLLDNLKIFLWRLNNGNLRSIRNKGNWVPAYLNLMPKSIEDVDQVTQTKHDLISPAQIHNFNCNINWNWHQMWESRIQNTWRGYRNVND